MKNKGFTLIELLAVIVLLGLIALIAIPVVVNLIGNSKKSALEDSAHGLIRSAQYYNSNKNLNGTPIEEEIIEFTGPDYKTSDGETLDFGGDKFEGIVRLHKGGKVSLAIFNEGYCAYKTSTETKVTVEEKSSLTECTATIQ